MKTLKSKGRFDLLNLASGPARDIFEFFQENPDTVLNVDCVELDSNAISFSKKLLRGFSDRVQFHNRNILRFTPTKQYDLIWSAGLFDYFNDDIFKRLISRFLEFVKPGGEMVVGNFCVNNPDIPYMHLLDWILHHRSGDELMNLAIESGAAPEHIRIETEPEGVNLFLRIRKP